MTDLRTELERVLALLNKAGAMDLNTAQHRDDGWYDCPMCSGDGAVEGDVYTNFDGVASGVQFFGFGKDLTDKEDFFNAAVNLLRTHGRELAGVVADSERLDWIAQQGDEFSSGIIQDAPGDGDYYVCGMGVHGYGTGKTFRDALDDARKRIERIAQHTARDGGGEG